MLCQPRAAQASVVGPVPNGPSRHQMNLVRTTVCSFDVMMLLMRTTVSIDDDLLAEAKERAARRHATLGAVINDALRVAFRPAPPGQPGARGRLRLPVDGGSGLQPGVDLEDRERLAELLDAHENTA